MSDRDDETFASQAPPAPDPAPATEPESESQVGPAAASISAPAKGDRRRRLLIALAIYVVCVGVVALVAGPTRLREHSPFNHYAQLADAWLHGRNDLANGPPAYAQGNDFARFGDKWFISFPPFPAMLMLPLVAMAGSPDNFQDGQFIVWLSGLAPAALFLALEKLRRSGRSGRSERENLGLSLLFAFGTVYFFTAVQGSVWFAAHVVGASLLALYLLLALDAASPWLAGLVVGLLFLTRPSTLLVAPLFALEAIRVSCNDNLPTQGRLGERITLIWQRLDKGLLARKWLIFSLPVLGCLAFASAYNHARFGVWSPSAFGHEHLTVVWHERMAKWGLFGYHYVAKNLGVALTILPWVPASHAAGDPSFQINEHGLALWFTTPLYLWLLWPRTRGFLHAALWLSAIGPIALDLMYQNSGWRQFGYRFSNDYAALLFLLLAVGGRPFGWLFKSAAVWSLAWNLFGAVSFDRAGYERYYWRDGTQKILYQDD